jgi:hypothetical protein
MKTGILLGLTAVTLLGVIVAVLGWGTPEVRSVTYDNRFDETVRVTSSGEEIVTLEPGESRSVATARMSFPREIRVLDTHGTTRYERTLTWEDLRSMGFRIVMGE